MKLVYYFMMFCCLSFLFTFLSCKEELIGQISTDNDPPKQVQNVVVENLPGMVKLTYDLPDDKDLLYVQATYTISKGTTVTKTSSFGNTMTIDGFGKSAKSVIQLICVDSSRNESAPITVEVEPSDSPIYDIRASLNVEVAFGGFKLFWLNNLNKQIVVGILKKDSVTGEFNYVENFYSSVADAQVSVRGQAPEMSTFGIFIKDGFENYTDTLFVDMQPYFEEEIPKSGFVGLKTDPAFVLYDASPMSELWDNITNVFANWYYIRPGNTILPYFTFDLGVKAKLSRFKIWHRSDYVFALHNPKEFEWYGTNDPNVANSVGIVNWETNPGWYKLGTFSVHKPSGDDNSQVTQEDKDFGFAGLEFEMPIDAPPVRYLRFKVITTWGGSNGLHLEEMAFWGQKEEG